MTSLSQPGCYPFSFSYGKYFILLFGAQGGQCNSTVPSGGFSSGILNIKSPKKYFLCIGGQGKTTKNGVIEGGFNGGGSGSSGNKNECGGSGGGQTDLRTIEDQVSSVILVAGAGGRDGNYLNITYFGGKGGGTREEDGRGKGYGTGGSLDEQKHGVGGSYPGDGHYIPSRATDGELGKGGNSISTAGGSTGGGGAGYFSGGGGADLAGGGGGSSYASSLIINWKTGYSNHTGNGFAFIQKLTISFASSTNQRIYFIFCLIYMLRS